MRNVILVTTLTCLGLSCITTTAHAGIAYLPEHGSQYASNQVLVKFKPNVSPSARLQTAEQLGAVTMETMHLHADWGVSNLPAGQTVEQAISLYAQDPNVASVQPNYFYQSTARPGPLPDPQYDQLWAVKNTGQSIATGTYPPPPFHGTAGADMNLEAAWNIQSDCSSVIVAVIDTGVNYHSSDLAANMWDGTAVGAPLHGWDFVGAGSNNPMDYNGHGTHVAGIIGAVGGNGIGTTGVCWKASIMAVRALDMNGSGTTASVVQSMDFAINHGAKIINMSLGGAGPFDPAFSDAITRAQTGNVLVVVAAGNSSHDNDVTPTWPCSFPQTNLICVAALDQNYALAPFSNRGANSVDVAAPGTNILSTWTGVESVLTDPLSAAAGGWMGSSNRSASGGGWGFGLNGPGLTNPNPWNGSNYGANTDDRAFKTFNLAGVDVALLTLSAVVNINDGDTFNANISSSGGDPFAGGVPVFSATNMNTGFMSIRSPAYDISRCISQRCSIGFQLSSSPNSTGNLGVALTSFSIRTLTLTSNSYKNLTGTSMATPQVTGVAALVWAHNPLYTYEDVANAIKQGGRTIPALAGKTSTGKAVDALGALTYINPSRGLAVVVH